MTKVRRFLALTSFERVLLVQALILLPLVRTSLAVLGYRRTRSWLDPLSRGGRLPDTRPATDVVPTFRSVLHGEHVHGFLSIAERMVNAAGRAGLVHATCLPRALVTCTLLRRNGVKATLKLGVRRQSDRLEAHAWVETKHATPRTIERSTGYIPLEAPAHLPIS